MKKNFPIQEDHVAKMKESEKMEKYLDLTRELKNCGTWWGKTKEREKSHKYLDLVRELKKL